MQTDFAGRGATGGISRFPLAAAPCDAPFFYPSNYSAKTLQVFNLPCDEIPFSNPCEGNALVRCFKTNAKTNTAKNPCLRHAQDFLAEWQSNDLGSVRFGDYDDNPNLGLDTKDVRTVSNTLDESPESS